MKSKEKRWKKTLYENQGFPDNYTDKTFLRDLRKNIAFKEISFFEAFKGSLVIQQEICAVTAFVIIYVYLYNGWVNAQLLFYVISSITLLGLIMHRIFTERSVRTELSNDMRTVLIFLVFGHLFSPVLHTLTDTISTDSIYTMTFCMMFVHLLFCDYGFPVAIVSNSVSLSAAIFGSVCLASRLPSAFHAFVLLTIGIECFVLFPYVRHRISKSIVISFVFVSIVLGVLFFMSTVITVLFGLIVILLNLVCPFLFVRYQKHKENIYGPWDEAVVNDAVNINELIYE